MSSFLLPLSFSQQTNQKPKAAVHTAMPPTSKQLILWGIKSSHLPLCPEEGSGGMDLVGPRLSLPSFSPDPSSSPCVPVYVCFPYSHAGPTILPSQDMHLQRHVCTSMGCATLLDPFTGFSLSSRKLFFPLYNQKYLIDPSKSSSVITFCKKPSLTSPPPQTSETSADSMASQLRPKELPNSAQPKLLTHRIMRQMNACSFNPLSYTAVVS